MEQSAVVFASICFLAGWITPSQALEAIDFSLIIMIAASIGISRAMELSGLSDELGCACPQILFIYYVSAPLLLILLFLFIFLCFSSIVANTLVCSAFLQSSSMTPWTLNLMVYVVALVLTEIVTNNAAAALVIPIALSAAKALNVSYKPFAMSVIMAASCGFAIPYGYACSFFSACRVPD
jgi:di/tricarboxylate transporter